MKIRVAILAALLAAANPAAAQTYADRAEVGEFVAEMVSRHGFTRRALENFFRQATYQDEVVTLMTPLPAGERSWQSYRARVLTARRIEGGADFWRRNTKTLARAASTYGVPAEIVVAIIGIETEYGRNTGDFTVRDTLATLAFDYPRRSEFFRAELEQLLLYLREARIDAARLRGSYAGAIGIPQFMPGTIRRYGVDFDRDGRRDLQRSTADAIGSVANFLARHGWIKGAPIAFPAHVTGDGYRRLLDDGVEPRYRAEELRALAVTFDDAVEGKTPTVLVALESPDAPPAYLVGLANFYVLTRYNRSSFYAAAVLELAEAVKAARNAKPPAAKQSKS